VDKPRNLAKSVTVEWPDIYQPMDQFKFHEKGNIFVYVDTYEKIKRLLDFKKGGLNILDVGCGFGLLGERLSKYKNAVTGLDVNENSNKKNFNFIKCDISENWPVQEKKFDVIICTDVMEHLYDASHIIKQAEKALKEEGFLIVGIPNHFDFCQRLRMLFGKGIVHWNQLQYGEKSWSYGHIRFLNLFEARDFFKNNDWQIAKEQFNFMGAGVVPASLTPAFARITLLKAWPNLFSGKFIFLLKKGKEKIKKERIYIPQTNIGM
jgi:2-polyprenyl-3-methyl-5-hydroxy-6-metoxy-1,4-benzoquinol methylase